MSYAGRGGEGRRGDGRGKSIYCIEHGLCGFGFGDVVYLSNLIYKTYLKKKIASWQLLSYSLSCKSPVVVAVTLFSLFARWYFLLYRKVASSSASASASVIIYTRERRRNEMN